MDHGRGSDSQRMGCVAHPSHGRLGMQGVEYPLDRSPSWATTAEARDGPEAEGQSRSDYRFQPWDRPRHGQGLRRGRLLPGAVRALGRAPGRRRGRLACGRRRGGVLPRRCRSAGPGRAARGGGGRRLWWDRYPGQQCRGWGRRGAHCRQHRRGVARRARAQSHSDRADDAAGAAAYDTAGRAPPSSMWRRSRAGRRSWRCPANTAPPRRR